MDTSDKLEQKRNWIRDELKKEFKISLRSYQIEPFLKLFFKHMNRKVDEISANQQAYIHDFFLILESLKMKKKKLHSSSSSLRSNTSSYSPEMRKHDLNVCKSLEGPLIGPKKLTFLQSVRNLLEEFLTTEGLSKYDRRLWTIKLCCDFCKLPKDLVLKWITSTKK